MTRAPRSASWRVAKGAAMACSRVTTVMPVKGCMAFSSADDRGCVHGQPAVVVLRPEADCLAIRLRCAAYRERVDVEGRTDRPEAIFQHLSLGALVAQQVEQQRRDQRPVHDQAWITLDLGHVAAVVVDAVAVE